MRRLLTCCLVGCTAAGPARVPPQSPQPTIPATAKAKKPPHERTLPVDVIAALSADRKQASWIVPGSAALERGGASIDAPGDAPVLEVDWLEAAGNDVRVGVRIETARFAMWTPRARMLAVLVRDERIEGDYWTNRDAVEVIIHAGAQVRRLAHDGAAMRTKVRYVGELEVEGWVADDSLDERGEPGRPKAARVPTGRKTLMVMPGAVIRSEANWTAQQLAVMNQGYFLDTINELDDGWAEVAYEDSDVTVHGFVSSHLPPGSTHRRPAPQPAQPVFAPNATLAEHTCLYSGDEAVGFTVGTATQALVDPMQRSSHVTITLDTPWGPIAFEGHGADAATLETCGP